MQWKNEADVDDYVKEAFKKLGLNKLENRKENELKFDDASISSRAFNGALHYAMGVIKNNKYKEAIAIGIAGDNKENVTTSPPRKECFMSLECY